MIDSNEDIKYNSEIIDLLAIYRVLARGKKVIISITSILTIFTFIYSFFLQKPKFTGNFQIVAQEKKENNLFDSLIPNNEIPLKIGLSNNQKTQEFILKSPSVLQPVYDFVIDEYSKRGDKIPNYKSWIKKSLKISFLKRSDILEISFTDSDKSFVIDTLDLISLKYKDYSRKDRRQNLTRVVNYLENQKELLAQRSLASLKELNKFSIDNGLGDIDGFISLDENSNISEINLGSNRNSEILRSLLKEDIPSNFSSENIDKNDSAGQRFSNQLRRLEKYELQYTDYSSKLRENSKLLKELKLRIENLKSSLKRPNEILIKYKELKKVAQRESNLLSNIENKLEIYKLELAKQDDPWELISSPTIELKSLTIERIQTIIPVFIVSLILSSSFIIIREKSLGKLFEKNQFLSSINSEYLDSFYLNNIPLSKKIISNLIKIKLDYQPIKNKIISVKITYFGQNQKRQFFDNLSKIKNINFSYSNINDLANSEDFDFVIFTVKPGDTKKDINLLNNYSKIFSDKLIGWILIDNTTEV